MSRGAGEAREAPAGGLSRARGYRATLTLAAGLVIAGLAFASSSLLVPGLGLALVAWLSRAWVAASAGSARVERLPGPVRVVEGEAYPLRLRIQRGPLPLPVARVEDPLARGPVRVGARRPPVVSMALRFPRRGRHTLGPPALTLVDPFGLCERTVLGKAGGELLVLPRVEPLEAAGGTGGSELGRMLRALEHGPESAGPETAAVDLEIDGVRPYRTGSPASRIHWRTVARSGEMFERRYVAGADAAPLVVIDASEPIGEEALDAAVRAAASLCFELARRGGCAVLLPDRATPSVVDTRLRGWPEVHARMALIESGSPVPIPRHARSRFATFWVTGAEAQRACRTSSRALPGSFVVSPAPAPGAPVVFHVAGCSGQRSLAAARAAPARLRAA